MIVRELTLREIEACQVLNTFVRETTALVNLYVDREVISTTGEHSFWIPGYGWVKAKDLQVGLLLQTNIRWGIGHWNLDSVPNRTRQKVKMA
ncbi:hypothetical protein [Nostoc sp. DSM 114159]